MKEVITVRKIPCLFRIDHEAHEATHDLNPNAEFILHRTDVRATIKRDGQAMLHLGDGHWMTRRAVNPGRTAPEGFILAQFDENTGKSFGWEPVENSSVRRAFNEALSLLDFEPEAGATLELCGPKVQGNPEGLNRHALFLHGSEAVEFPAMRELREAEDVHDLLLPLFTELHARGLEGVVLWSEGAPAVKVRVKDFPEFGLARR